jgi:hypothetical protein
MRRALVVSRHAAAGHATDPHYGADAPALMFESNRRDVAGVDR